MMPHFPHQTSACFCPRQSSAETSSSRYTSSDLQKGNQQTNHTWNFTDQRKYGMENRSSGCPVSEKHCLCGFKMSRKTPAPKTLRPWFSDSWWTLDQEKIMKRLWDNPQEVGRMWLPPEILETVHEKTVEKQTEQHTNRRDKVSTQYATRTKARLTFQKKVWQSHVLR